jgi:high-affinity nickel permease
MEVIYIFIILVSLFGAGYSLFKSADVVMEKIQTAKQSTAILYYVITLTMYSIVIIANVIKLAAN